MKTPSPYYNQDFVGFFQTLALRLKGLLTGELPLATDELQIAVLILLSISTATVGTFLVLRRMAMLANGLSHSILLGIVLTYLAAGTAHLTGTLNFQLLFVAAIGTGLVTSFLTEFLTNTVKLQEDASIGLVFNTFFSLGVILITLFTRNTHISSELVMGNVDALHPDDLQLVFWIALINLALFIPLYRGYKVTTFDPQFSTALGYHPKLYNYLLMLQVSITCVGAFRAVGVLLVLALLTGPPLTARRLSHRLPIILLLACSLSALAAVLSVAITRHLLTVYGMPLSTSGMMVCVITVLFLISLIFTKPIHKAG